MNDPAGQEKIIERISNQEKAFLDANAKLKEYTASLKEYRESLTSDGAAQPNNDEATQKISQNIKQMKTELQGYIDEVKKLVQSG
jgi:cytochrome c556